MWTIVKSGVAAAIAVAAVAATAPSAAQAEAEFKLRYSDLGPPRGSRPEAMMWWADEIKKRTNGRVEIEFFWSQSLVKAKETMKAVGALLGVATTGLFLMGLAERRDAAILRMGIDSIFVIATYIGGLVLLYSMRGTP